MSLTRKAITALLLVAALGATVACGSRTTVPDARPALQKQLNRLTKDGAPGAIAWGHPGSFAGYIIWTWTSPSGNRQAVLALNEQPESLPRPAFPKFARLLTSAFCRKSD